MRVVTTAPPGAAYVQRWLDSRKNWPEGTDFQFYTEGVEVDCPGKDFKDLQRFIDWKELHRDYVSPSWEWDVVRFSHKVFAAADALYDYQGVGVWLDADCVTYKPVPEGLIEKQVEGVYMACYQRTGLHTETGLWIVDCSHPIHKEFMDLMRGWYLSEEYKKLPQWHDCFVLDACIRQLKPPVRNLSGEHHMNAHPQALSELGQYIDHCKGLRKKEGRSPENKFHDPAVV